MSLQTFRMISRVLRFDNRDTRARSDKLAPIRDVWERWTQLLPLMFNPGPEVTVDELVLDMTAGLQGHNITCDNFFTSYDLGQELLRRKLTMVGTVKKNKPELPAEILQTAAERTLHSVHAISNTKSIRNSILLSQPCLNTNQNSHSHNPTQAT
ncbi:hypothetical protein D4764_13G0008920 [Takifugu flavidus]|uniref:PiggyBac transposable element-derived protein domain-containing protein n=1 Tax=Takifugu flavidus TaxID=433684 RepID=A0A5C6PDB3_9TELE|nr:hypothetical protein D4764_13G0008920 [Takifugu flavidus]